MVVWLTQQDACESAEKKEMDNCTKWALAFSLIFIVKRLEVLVQGHNMEYQRQTNILRVAAKECFRWPLFHDVNHPDAIRRRSVAKY